MTSCGLTLLPSHSYLGASADGIIIDPQCPTEPGVLEIKCPVSVDGESVLALAPADIAAKYKGFYLHNHDGQVHLKPTSNYYYQVQGEMAIKSCKLAHFVVWTPANGGSIFGKKFHSMTNFGNVKCYLSCGNSLETYYYRRYCCVRCSKLCRMYKYNNMIYTH